MKYSLIVMALVFSLFPISCLGREKKIKQSFTVSDVENSIKLAQEYLLAQQNTKNSDPNFGSWIKPGSTEKSSRGLDTKFWTGQTGHIVYALLESGIHPQNKKIKIALEWLVKKQKESASLRQKYVSVFKRIKTMKKSSDTYKQLSEMEKQACDQTYNIVFRALAFSVAVKKGAKQYIIPLKRDVKWLYSCSIDGAYGYTCTGKKLAMAKAKKRSSTITVNDLRRLSEFYVDASNSQYGLYGVWAGMVSGMQIPKQYWKQVATYWRSIQNKDGGWGYTVAPRPKTTFSRRGSHPSMTAAAIASLYVSLDATGDPKIAKSLTKAIAWFEKHFADSMDPSISSAPEDENKDAASFNINYYYLYGIERVALACGSRKFGDIDWYKRGGSYILSKQYRGEKKYLGSWSGRWVDGYRLGATSYALLFLSRGLHPVLFNKLQYKGGWNTCSRDMANLSRWLGKELERDINWRHVSVDSNPDHWHDTPILYISGRKPPVFTDKQLDNLRQYALQGGTIFSCPAGKDAGFSDGIKKIYKKIFPECQWKNAIKSHPIYTIHFKLDKSLKIEAAFNGIRPMAIHTNSPLPASWQKNLANKRPKDFEFGFNLYRFVTNGAPLLKRGKHSWPDTSKTTKRTSIKIVRLLHADNSNPEPLAIEAFRRRMANEQIFATVLKPTKISRIANSKANIAFLSGTGTIKLSKLQSKSLKTFIARGGTVIADAAGGSDKFYRNLKSELEKSLNNRKFVRINKTHKILTMPGKEIVSVKMRQTNLAPQAPQLETISYRKRDAVILCPADITAGLVGYRSFGIHGYIPKDAFRICRNIVLFATAK